MSDQRDRFDPQTGLPIEYPAEPAQPLDTAATNYIAPPGQVHPDQAGARAVQEPRDVILGDPQLSQISSRMSVAQRIAARARARDNSLISVALPDMQETVRVMPKPWEVVLADVGIAGTLSRAAQTAMLKALKEIDAMPPDERMRVGEDIDLIAQKIGIGGAIEFQRALLATYPVACMSEPRCVPTAADITDPDHEIALEWLSQDDRKAIVTACMVERDERTVAVAPFRDQPAVATA